MMKLIDIRGLNNITDSHKFMSRLSSCIDILTRYKHLKSPQVPFCLKACCDELLDRIHLGQLRVLPNSIAILISNALEAKKSRIESIEEILENLSNDRKLNSASHEESRRITECATIPTHMLFAVLWEFLNRCHDSLVITLYYPLNGWIITGPPYVSDNDMKDEGCYLKGINDLLDQLHEKITLKRDMFCYIMNILTTLIQNAVENNRTQPSLSSMVRYHIAYLFGPVLLNIKCAKCDGQIEDRLQTCNFCAVPANLLQKPYTVDVMDRLLRHLPPEFWNNALIAPRSSSSVKQDGDSIHTEIVNYFRFKSKEPAETKMSTAPKTRTQNISTSRQNPPPTSVLPAPQPTAAPPTKSNATIPESSVSAAQPTSKTTANKSTAVSNQLASTVENTERRGSIIQRLPNLNRLFGTDSTQRSDTDVPKTSNITSDLQTTEEAIIIESKKNKKLKKPSSKRSKISRLVQTRKIVSSKKPSSKRRNTSRKASRRKRLSIS